MCAMSRGSVGPAWERAAAVLRLHAAAGWIGGILIGPGRYACWIWRIHLRAARRRVAHRVGYGIINGNGPLRRLAADAD
jgi:hypothetical protein